ncbi:hypothetical protein IWQ61_005165 [Dispira simplex]|nr:hypothetical protein IWQ61_005165 [Dispira simplex]
MALETINSTPTAALRIGWIGLGSMGLPMAVNLQTLLSQTALNAEVVAQLPFAVNPVLTVYNRTLSKCKSVVTLGAKVATSVTALATECQVIFTSLANDAAVETVYADILAGLVSRPKGVLQPVYLVETSTISPELTTKLNGQIQLRAAAQPTTQPIYFLRCPVFGPPTAAQCASLVWVLSGPEPARRAIQQLVIPSLGRGVLDVGDDVIQGSHMKLMGNFFVASAVETLAEGAVLAEKSGLGTAKMVEFLQWMFPAGSFTVYGRKMVRPEEREALHSDNTTSTATTINTPMVNPSCTSTPSISVSRRSSQMVSSASPPGPSVLVDSVTMAGNAAPMGCDTPVSTPTADDTSEEDQDGFITDVGFTVDLGLKDVGLIRQFAKSHQCSVPAVDAFHRHLSTMQQHGCNRWDWSSAVVASRWEAQLPGYYNDTSANWFPKDVEDPSSNNAPGPSHT